MTTILNWISVFYFVNKAKLGSHIENSLWLVKLNDWGKMGRKTNWVETEGQTGTSFTPLPYTGSAFAPEQICIQFSQKPLWNPKIGLETVHVGPGSILLIPCLPRSQWDPAPPCPGEGALHNGEAQYGAVQQYSLPLLSPCLPKLRIRGSGDTPNTPTAATYTT